MPSAEGSEGQRDVIVLHETGGEKYFEAIKRLHTTGALSSLEFFEPSVIRKFFWDVLRRKRGIRQASVRAAQNARFRCAAPRLRGKVVILALAPWDLRFPPHALLRRKNRLVYHTSWPYWDGSFVPRRYGVVTGALKHMWLSALADPAVDIVAVTAAAAEGVGRVLRGKTCQVIPHAVSDEFYQVRATWSGDELRVVFIGDLIRSKGVHLLPEIDRRLAHLPVRFDVVGDGPARGRIESERSGRIHLHGAIRDRSRLASLLGRSHLLVLPSQRTGTWEELFGMVVAEAMSAGVPVVASNHAGPRSLIVPDVSGVLVPEDDPAPFAAAIARFMERPERWRAMSDACRQGGREFALEHVMARWRNLLT